jgi:hypothetical protein
VLQKLFRLLRRLDGLHDCGFLARNRNRDRNEATIPGIPTDLACCHTTSPSFPGLLTRHYQARPRWESLG